MANVSPEANPESLPKPLQQVPLILDRIMMTAPVQETPPHITAMSKPKLDSRASTPASASGILDRDACLARDKDGRSPVHVASVTSVVAAAHGVNREGSVLHPCVGCCRFEDHLQIIDYLLNRNLIEANTANSYGLSPIHIQFQTLRHQNDVALTQTLQNNGAAKPENPDPRPPRTRALYQSNRLEKHDDWIERQRDALMVVASLIASMGFTAGVAPPAGVLLVQREPTAWSYYSRFLVYNTVSFMSSISIILLLVSGVPFRRRAFMWILMVVVWVAVASTACTYAVAIEHHLQYKDVPVLRSLFGFGLLTWVFVMVVVVGFHMSRVYVMVVGKFRKRARVHGREVGMQAV